MANENYPPVSFYFKVSFLGGGISSETSFKEVSGLSVDMSPEEITEGGNLGFKHRLPTTPKYSNLVLKRGLVTDSKLREWLEKAINEFSFTPITVTIELLNPEGQAAMSWKVTNAWPVKWELSNLDSTGNDLALETLELAFDSFTTKTG